MIYLILIVTALILLIGFLVLSIYEANRGTRYFEGFRATFDHRVEKTQFVLTHVDLQAFLYDEVRHLSARFGHDIVHLVLQMVRFAERFLTRLVRRLRTKQVSETVAREPSREFVKTLSDFKEHLEVTRPQVPNVFDVEK